jgi:plasmid stabilization system protein ParE
MKLQISDRAWADLDAGRQFYENQSPGVGSYFLNSLFSDIDSLFVSAGVHNIVGGYHRIISRRFPFAVYYKMEGEYIRVRRVLDCRRNPIWIRRQLNQG